MFATSVIIENCVISKDNSGFRITPINLVQKLYPTFNIEASPKITTGNKFDDHILIQKLCDGKIQFKNILKLL